ncbi:MAG: nucleoside hydrolase [Erysipelotrichaceae bacterium]|nr:nucleoside hydrolase [Erysipelotrichaceae bacterium]
MTKTKMIIDCDTGVDDALAIAYILADPQIELLGITTTYGNIDLDSAAKNSLSILELFYREDVGVYKGAKHAYGKSSYVRGNKSPMVHGDNGIGNVDLGTPKQLPRKENAADFIIDSAKKYKQDLHLVFVGPLTDLADCIRKDLDALKLVGDITIMGGALTVKGNKSIYAEANIGSDPAAAKEVFASPLHLSIIPLDATLKTLFKVSDIRAWQGLGLSGKALYEIARFYYVHELGGEETGGAMHDPLAAYASIDPSIISNWFSCNLTVEESGRTIGSFEELNLKEKRHRVALDVDAKRFTDDYINKVTELIKRS